MEELEPISEDKHAELLMILNPLIDFMIENKYNYFLVAGKDEICTRHLRGKSSDISGMITGMMKKNKEVEEIIKDSMYDLKNNLD